MQDAEQRPCDQGVASTCDIPWVRGEGGEVLDGVSVPHGNACGSGSNYSSSCAKPFEILRGLCSGVNRGRIMK
jgi:hypothetical protein